MSACRECCFPRVFMSETDIDTLSVCLAKAVKAVQANRQ